MTISELNERAARLCGRKLVEHFEEWDVELRMVISQTVEFNPCTSPADCAVVMEAMEKRGWVIVSVGPQPAGYYAQVVRAAATLDDPMGGAFGTTRWHAVTLAAVRATEGESK